MGAATSARYAAVAGRLPMDRNWPVERANSLVTNKPAPRFPAEIQPVSPNA